MMLNIFCLWLRHNAQFSNDIMHDKAGCLKLCIAHQPMCLPRSKHSGIIACAFHVDTAACKCTYWSHCLQKNRFLIDMLARYVKFPAVDQLTYMTAFANDIMHDKAGCFKLCIAHQSMCLSKTKGFRYNRTRIGCRQCCVEFYL